MAERLHGQNIQNKPKLQKPMPVYPRQQNKSHLCVCLKCKNGMKGKGKGEEGGMEGKNQVCPSTQINQKGKPPTSSTHNETYGIGRICTEKALPK